VRQHKDGALLDVSITVSPVRDASGRIVGASKVARDITPRRAAERALEASELRFRMLAAHAPVGIFLADANGDFGFVNECWVEMTGVTEEQARGGGWARAVHPDDRPKVLDGWLDAVAAGRSYAADCRLRSPAGVLTWAHLRGTPLRDGDGRLDGYVGTFSDITERRLAVETLQDAGRRKDEFLAVLAHELRNPLAPLRNGLQLLRLTSGDPAATARTQDMMERQLTHLVRLVDDLLDVSRISRNKLELRRARVRLTEVLNTAVETARPGIEAAGQQLICRFPDEPVHLHADLTRLAQVFGNLLNNSSKFTAPGGTIAITARAAEGRVAVEVRDTGIGIPPGELDRIFDMFSQLERGHERHAGGLGIGLAVVRGLVEMHGGTVEAASPGPGQGSSFTVTLPTLAEGAEEVAAAEAAAAVPRQARRVLVVDDNVDAATSMAAMLELLGNEAHTAHDGVEAVRLAASVRPHVVLMDIGMPRLDGYAATRAIRSEPWGRDVAIVALTGWGQEADRTRSREAGCDAHLVKPVTLDSLQQVLAELLGDDA
jgi:PAS domain S-box-containing protein